MIRDWKPCTLTWREVGVLRGLANALYDPRGTGNVERDFPQLIDELEAWLAAPDIVARFALRALLIALELSPLRFGFGPRSLSSLSSDERARCIRALETRGDFSFDVWKSLIGTAYFSLPNGATELRTQGPIPGARRYLEVAS